MTEAKKFSEQFIGKEPKLKAGTLRFYGNWFGKPVENYHTVIKVSYIELEDCLVFEFDDHEILSVWNAEKITVYENHFSIQSASWLRWVWYAYDSPQTPDHLLFIEFYHSAGKISGRSNSEFIKFDGFTEPAIEIF